MEWCSYMYVCVEFIHTHTNTHTHTHTEFQSQLESLLFLLVRIPQLVFGRAWQKHQGGAKEDRERLTEAHREWTEAMAAEKVGWCVWHFSFVIIFP